MDEVVYHLEHVADYYPYGKILREYVADEDEKFLTTHHERDVETGLDYRGARFYDGEVGRFLSVDPLAADYAGWSTYNYVLGNPVRLVDPSGKAPESWSEDNIDLANRFGLFGQRTSSIDDYFVFNENGEFVRREKNSEPDQIVIENSKTLKRKAVQFNDPSHDVALLEASLEFYRDDAIGMKFLVHIGKGDIEKMMDESNVRKRGLLGRLFFTATESVGGSLDFSVYHLPSIVTEKTGRNMSGSSYTILHEKQTMFFMFGNERTMAFNWLDAGNWLWGNAINRMGGSFTEAETLARRYNRSDSSTDLNAIANGWFYYSGFRSYRNIPSE